MKEEIKEQVIKKNSNIAEIKYYQKEIQTKPNHFQKEFKEKYIQANISQNIIENPKSQLHHEKPQQKIFHSMIFYLLPLDIETQTVIVKTNNKITEANI